MALFESGEGGFDTATVSGEVALVIWHQGVEDGMVALGDLACPLDGKFVDVALHEAYLGVGGYGRAIG